VQQGVASNGSVLDICRHNHNPLFTAGGWGSGALAVFNPGAVKRQSGHVGLVVRVTSENHQSHLSYVESVDGFGGWSTPFKLALGDVLEQEPPPLGLEDARVSRLSGLDEYIIAYTRYSRAGSAVAAALTTDFRRFEQLPTLLPVENKNAAVFPRRIGGRWWMFHRPTLGGGYRPASIWICSSPDLRHWGEHSLVLETRSEGSWDGFRVGIGPPPIETEYGWVALYHGVCKDTSRIVYRIGALLLHKDDPRRVLSRPSSYIMEPEEDYELMGRKRVIFCNGWVLDRSRDIVTLYYGASDRFVCAAQTSLSGLLNYLLSESPSTS
jgi:predicted GH43/DUF377 family glycosyl hydrolase